MADDVIKKIVELKLTTSIATCVEFNIKHKLTHQI